MSFFKRLADIINQEHWRIQKSDRDLVARFSDEYGASFEKLDFSQIHSIEFINSLCVIRKASSEKNILGKRVIVGENEEVTSGVKKFNGTLIQGMPVDVKEDGNLDVFDLTARSDSLVQENLNLAGKMKDKEQVIQTLTTEMAEKEQTLRELTAQRDQFRNEAEQMRAEVLRYALSRSWIMTRPVRKLMQWMGRRKNA
jgi:hypothetical protein